MDSKNIGKIEHLLDELNDLEPTINSLKKLQESGLMGAVDAISEQSDNIFNYATTMTILGAFSAFVKLLPILSKISDNIDFDELQNKISSIQWESLIKVVNVILDFVSVDLPKIENSSKGGVIRVLSDIKSPETEYLLRIMEEFSKRLIKEFGSQK